MKKLLLLLLLINIAGCSCSGNKPEITVGTDTGKIAGFLDFTKYKPEQVHYKLTHIGDGRLGPSDYSIEAVLYFDSATFTKLREEYSYMDYPVQDQPLSIFNFRWLPKDIKQEIKQRHISDIAPGSLFADNPNCSILFLKNKVIIEYWTN